MEGVTLMAAGQPGRPRKAAKAAQPKAEAVKTEPIETDEQLQIRELKEQIALLTAAVQSVPKTQAAADKYEDKEGDTVLIHFIDDGFTAQGTTWYRGQEVEVVVGSKQWNDSLDREGNSWFSMTEEDQLDKYDKAFFRRGEWKGKKSYLEGEFVDPDKAPPQSELEKADKLERDRRRAAPLLPDIEKAARESL